MQHTGLAVFVQAKRRRNACTAPIGIPDLAFGPGGFDIEVKNNQVFAVDANSFFSKPSIRTVEGLEILSKIIQPDIFKDLSISESSYSNITQARHKRGLS